MKAQCDGGTCGLGGFCDSCPLTPRNQWAEQLTDQIENAPATEQHWPEKAEEKGVIEWDGL